MIRKIAGLALTVSLIIGCKKEVGPLSDIKPDIPVTVTNAIAYRPDPAVSTSLAGGGNIQIILSIPESSGRTIKEVKIATNTSYSAIQSTGTTGFYTTAPIAASGTTFTFNTTIAQYFVINPLNPISNPAARANAELARRFYFRITLDDDSVIISRPVRILVLA